MNLKRIAQAAPLNGPLKWLLALSLTLASLLLAACGSGDSPSTSSTSEEAAPAQTSALNGTVHGGQSPVSGSTITLYAAGSGLAVASVLATTTSDANGNWGFSSYTCPSASAAIYVIASGGNPGMASGTNNSALNLMAALGPCGSLPGTVNIDEVTTVAAAYALNGFIGPNGCVDCSSGLPANVSNVHGKSPGLTNAMGNAARLASVTAGSASPPLPSAAACAASSPPANCGAEQRLNALANSLAACVNSTGPGSMQCMELFDCATPGAIFKSAACTVPSGSSLATDTLTAVLEIARNPGQVAIAGVYDVATRNPVFSPALNAAPNDWTLALNITGGGLNTASDDDTVVIAIDSNGDAWVANRNGSSVSEFSPAGVALSSGSGYTSSNLTNPYGIAIDTGGNVWVPSSSSLTEFSVAGIVISGSGYNGGGLGYSVGIAIDLSNNVWVTNETNPYSLSKFNSAGTAVSTSSGYTGGGLFEPYSIAIDANNNVWVANFGNNSISEFNSAGTAISGSNGYTGGGLADPVTIAIDPSGNVWTTSNINSSLNEFSSAGMALSGSNGYTGGGLNNPFGLAIDAGGNVWVPNSSGDSLSEFNSAGTALTGSNGYTGGGLYDPFSVAIDSSGDVWVLNNNSSLTEVIGAAVPTRTPLVSAIKNGFTP